MTGALWLTRRLQRAEKFVGKGAFSKVYRGVEVATGEAVALKVADLQTAKPDELEAFQARRFGGDAGTVAGPADAPFTCRRRRKSFAR